MMTSKEAIRILELYNPFLGGDDKKILSEAIELAIEALNHFADDSKKVSFSRGQENDPVSRKAAIDAFDTHADEIIIGGEENARNVLNYLNKVIDTIKGLPSAQPEVLKCKDCYWWTKQSDSLQGRCDRYGFYPTGYWYCAAARGRREE